MSKKDALIKKYMRSVNELGFGTMFVAILFFAMLFGGLAWIFYKLLTEEIETMESGDKQ